MNEKLLDALACAIYVSRLAASGGTVDAATGICTSCGAVAFAPLGSEASAGKQEPRLGSKERA